MSSHCRCCSDRRFVPSVLVSADCSEMCALSVDLQLLLLFSGNGQPFLYEQYEVVRLALPGRESNCVDGFGASVFLFGCFVFLYGRESWVGEKGVVQGLS